MEIAYYPGCTLKTKGRNLEESALASMSALGVEMMELPRWTCCGTVYSLATDDLIHQLAPVRNLLRVKEQGQSKVVTLCSMCYNTLKRANLLIRTDAEKRDKINSFMYEEELDYNGEVDTVHLLEILRDDIGFEKVAESVKAPLQGLKLAPYYGCLLLRPREIGLDDLEQPSVLSDFIRCLGAEVLEHPYQAECCGAYQTVNQVDLVVERTREIVGYVVQKGADALVLSCPLCDFNLSRRQKEVIQKYENFTGVPTLYFTQLLALALGLDEKVCRFDLNYIDPRPLLRGKGLIS